MKLCARRFNIYLALAAMTLTLGCQTSPQSLRDKKVSALRIHIQSPAMGTGQTVSVLRSSPVLVSIVRQPILTEADVLDAKVIDTPGGFAIEIQFDERSTWLLEQYSASNPGKHFAIFGQWGEKLVNARWLAAPLITRRIGDGGLAFTPDASREESDELVLGLNNVSKKIRKTLLK